MPLREYLAATYTDAAELNRLTILQAVIAQTGGTVVDLGCGNGAFTASIGARAGADLLMGLEVEPEAVAQARAHGVEVLEADLAECLPFDSGSVDVVHSNQVIEHLADTDHFLAEIRRVLSPDGYAIVSTNNLASWHNVASLVMGWQPPPCQVSNLVNVGNPLNFMEGDTGGWFRQHLRLFTGRALLELAEFHGLRADLLQTAGFYPLPRRLARIATRVDAKHAAYLVHRYRPADARRSAAPTRRPTSARG
jgi:SAM-dependent methyltransferase